MKCAVNGCIRPSASQSHHCIYHIVYPRMHLDTNGELELLTEPKNEQPMSTKYPKYYKPIPKGMTELDIYAVCQMFNVTDAAITHSLKKLMLPGVRTGGKSRHADIKEARDTLTRWLELNPEVKDHGNGYAK